MSNPNNFKGESIMLYKNIISHISEVNWKANKVILNQLKTNGINGIVPSHGDILVKLFVHEKLTLSELAKQINKEKNTQLKIHEITTKTGWRGRAAFKFLI